MALETPNHLFAAVVWDLVLDDGGPDFAIEVKRAINVANFGLVAPDDFTAYQGTFIDRASQLEVCCNALLGAAVQNFFVAPLLSPSSIPFVDALPGGDFAMGLFPPSIPGAGERVRMYVQMHRLPLLAGAVA